MTIGILALQGDYQRHVERLQQLNSPYKLIRQPNELNNVRGLIIPGGESTALLKLMAPFAWEVMIKQFCEQGRWIFGTCAGAILLAQEVNPTQSSLNLIDITVQRNAYGRQLQSFICECQPKDKRLGQDPMECVFIRAPKITRLGSKAKILLEHKQDPILVQQDRIFVATFHPELSAELRLHEFLVKQS